MRAKRTTASSGVLRPMGGAIRLDGHAVAGSSSSDMIRRGVVMVPEGRHVFPDMTVAENLDLGAYYRRDRAGVREDVSRVLTLFPILRDRLRDLAKADQPDRLVHQHAPGQRMGPRRATAPRISCGGATAR